MSGTDLDCPYQTGKQLLIELVGMPQVALLCSNSRQKAVAALRTENDASMR